jgi:hypothetical protein
MNGGRTDEDSYLCGGNEPTVENGGDFDSSATEDLC